MLPLCIHPSYQVMWLTNLNRTWKWSIELGDRSGHVQPHLSGGFQWYYSLKFRGSEVVWEIYFVSSRGPPRIFRGSYQMPWIWTLSEDENPNFSRLLQLVMWTDCFALHCWRMSKQLVKHHQSCFLRFMQLLHILFRCWTCCYALSKVLMRRWH